MRSLAYTTFLAIFPLFVGSSSAAVMIDWFDRIASPYQHGLPLLALPIDDFPNHNVVSPTASPRAITDGLPVIDPLVVRHGINVPSGEPAVAAQPCPALVLCNGSISSISTSPVPPQSVASIPTNSVPTGCAGCVNPAVAVPSASVGTPEPLPWALAGLGLVVLALVRRRRSRI
jgi:MYXO-CTERM domain-containing protein